MQGGWRIGEYLLRPAQGEGELEAVYRFRYEHFFRCFAGGYPGLDSVRKRVFESHDCGSTHYCAFDPEGNLCAVSTATQAAALDIPAIWQDWFQLSRLLPLGLDRIVVSTRMVIHPDHRNSSLFDLFYRFIIERYLEAGFDFALHYCSPGLICRYEHLGHRLYGGPFVIPTGILRVPMLIALNDPCHLRKVRSPIAGLLAARTTQPWNTPPAALPEIGLLSNFHILSPEERLSYVSAGIRADRLPSAEDLMPVLEHASLLRLEEGMGHAAPPSGGLLCLIVKGTIQEQGAGTAAGPGDFAGAGLLIDPATPAPPFTVLTEAEVLFFDQALTRAAMKAGRDKNNLSPWHLLRVASGRL
ncbi:MAG: hypothetical protein AB9866_05250 [Syntrophobacteraceae bacterium]